MRYFLFVDILKRVLLYNGLQVRHVMNITDVGHLTSDADTGEDKLEKGARREKKTVWQVAQFYTDVFKKDIKNLKLFLSESKLRLLDILLDYQSAQIIAILAVIFITGN